MDGNDILVAWLNDAYGMENALEQILEHQVKDAKDYPMIQERLEQHLVVTRQHAGKVKSCIERLGGNTSTVKSVLSNIFGQVQALSTGAAQDEMVKNALADYAAENFEVASYTALVSAAQDLGDPETARICEEIRLQDQDMANWLEQNLPTLVQETMSAMMAAAR